MSRSQREKGKRGELQVRDVFREAGFDCWRTPNSGGLQEPGDLQGLDGLHVEVKYQERVRIKDWIEQAEEDCPPDDIALLAWRTSGMRWRGDVDLLWLCELLAENRRLREAA